jgi:hypothetical protein
MRKVKKQHVGVTLTPDLREWLFLLSDQSQRSASMTVEVLLGYLKDHPELVRSAFDDFHNRLGV